MRDVFEAIEQLSTLLAMRLEHAARKRGWATRPDAYTRTLNGQSRGRMVRLVATTEEIFFRTSYTEGFVPDRIRNATWHW